jgi:hypothetical protein
MHGRIRRYWLGAAGLAALGVALGLLVPLALAGGDHAKRASAVTCTVSSTPTPAFPLELNTVAFGTLAKTVAMEKDVLNCQGQGPSGTVSLTRDVETFVDVAERIPPSGTPTVTMLAPTVFVSICDKTPAPAAAGGGIACKQVSVRVTKATAPPLTNQCGQPIAQLPDPVEMNSINFHDDWVKTIKVEKEIYSCNDGTTFNDLYLFTELLEKKNANGDNFTPPIARVVGVFCQRNKFDGTIGPCNWFTPTALS